MCDYLETKLSIAPKAKLSISKLNRSEANMNLHSMLATEATFKSTNLRRVQSVQSIS